ncbi:SurA N-terminal domain-containing protein [Alphaproteobacteria bacterium KMM 3653]|uniref:SurA N-terminal domain-containing protein n=1 Tax=Harenicola maris TaxID=2841044 RepID=A0AAP2CL91_9RHOB|nr:SurA N-terminal domain-containing protein [Harenicola maris]
MAKSVGKKASNFFVWGLLGLLAISLVGFGAGGFGGTVNAIGYVGDREIDANEYFRAASNAINAQSQAQGRVVGFAEAQQTGLLEQVRGQLVSEAAIDNETDRIGLSVGDERVRDQVLARTDMRGLDGTFDRAAYEATLRQSGYSVEGFEDRIRDETARTLYQGAVIGGVAPPAALVDTLMGYFGERRSFRWIRIGQDAMDGPLPEPTQEELQAYYDENEADFTLPEMKRITFVWLTPEMIAADMPADETALRALYDSRITEFQVPERRLVERLVFANDEAAAAAKARLDAGEVTFADLVTERGLTLEDIDQGEATLADLGAAGEAIFAMTEPGITDPLPTNLGPAIYRMNGILNAQITSFDQAKAELSEELGHDSAARAIADLTFEVEDKLAAGATLEELAEETDLRLGTIDFWDGLGESIANYNSFRDAALVAEVGDFPEALSLEDGGVFALRMDEALAPRLQSLEAVLDKVTAGWENRETETRLTARAQQVQAQLEVGVTLEGSGFEVQTAEALTRDGFIEGTPDTLIPQVFEMTAEESRVLPGFGAVFLVILDKIEGPDMEDERIALLQNIWQQQASVSLTGDIYNAFSRALTQEAGFTLNPTALNAVHASFAQ